MLLVPKPQKKKSLQGILKDCLGKKEVLKTPGKPFFVYNLLR